MRSFFSTSLCRTRHIHTTRRRWLRNGRVGAPRVATRLSVPAGASPHLVRTPHAAPRIPGAWSGEPCAPSSARGAPTGWMQLVRQCCARCNNNAALHRCIHTVSMRTRLDNDSSSSSSSILSAPTAVALAVAAFRRCTIAPCFAAIASYCVTVQVPSDKRGAHDTSEPPHTHTLHRAHLSLQCIKGFLRAFLVLCDFLKAPLCSISSFHSSLGLTL